MHETLQGFGRYKKLPFMIIIIIIIIIIITKIKIFAIIYAKHSADLIKDNKLFQSSEAAHSNLLEPRTE